MQSSEVLRILGNMVSYNTVNDPTRGLRPSRDCAEYIKEELRSRGLDAEILESNGYYTVHGMIGRGRPRILFLAHWDTVPVDPSEWSKPPFELTIEGDRAYGRGAADDKGNVAAMILALERLADEGLEGLYYAFTGDEEIGGRNGAAVIAGILEEKYGLPEFLVNGDGVGHTVIVRRRNAFRVTVRIPRDPVTVRGSHISVEFQARTPVMENRHAAYFIPGVDTHPLIAASHWLRVKRGIELAGVEGGFLKSNVIPGWVRLRGVEARENGVEAEADRSLTRLVRAVVPLTRTPIKTEMYSDYGVTITPNILRSTSDSWELTLDVRAMITRVESVCSAIEAVVAEALQGASVECGGGGGYLYTSKDSAIVKAALEAAERAGIGVSIGEGAGASDSRFYSPRGVQAIDFGPIGGNIHGPDEWVSIKSLESLPEFYAGVARILLRSH